jgi:hypothetical protein
VYLEILRGEKEGEEVGRAEMGGRVGRKREG